MSRQSWNRIKRSKSFYVVTYRRTLKALLLSLALNVLLGLFVGEMYWNMPERAFYATNGALPPIKLTPLEQPNRSSKALLPPDPIDTNEQKAIPQ